MSSTVRGGAEGTAPGRGRTPNGAGGSGGVESGGSGAAKAAGVGLWVIVGAGLAYGISQTAVKVAALFG